MRDRRRENTANFADEAAVSGMPAKASRKSAKTPATHGCRLAQPGPLRQVGRLAAALSRTSVTTAKAPMVANP